MLNKKNSFFCFCKLPTPSQRSKDGPQPDADAVDDDGDVAGDEDDGVDVRGDHLSAWWLQVNNIVINIIAIIIMIIIIITISIIIITIIFLPGGFEKTNFLTTHPLKMLWQEYSKQGKYWYLYRQDDPPGVKIATVISSWYQWIIFLVSVGISSWGRSRW